MSSNDASNEASNNAVASATLAIRVDCNLLMASAQPPFKPTLAEGYGSEIRCSGSIDLKSVAVLFSFSARSWLSTYGKINRIL